MNELLLMLFKNCLLLFYPSPFCAFFKLIVSERPPKDIFGSSSIDKIPWIRCGVLITFIYRVHCGKYTCLIFSILACVEVIIRYAGFFGLIIKASFLYCFRDSIGYKPITLEQSVLNIYLVFLHNSARSECFYCP